MLFVYWGHMEGNTKIIAHISSKIKNVVNYCCEPEYGWDGYFLRMNINITNLNCSITVGYFEQRLCQSSSEVKL